MGTGRGMFIVFFGTPFLFLESPWGVVGQIVCVGVSQSHINPTICVPNMVSVRRSCRKRGVQTYTGTLQLYIVDVMAFVDVRTF